jgi:hypothetical protein
MGLPGLYGIFGEDLYEIEEPRLKANTLIVLDDAAKPTTSVKVWNDEKMEVNISLSNLGEDSTSNGDAAFSMKNGITNSGLTSIEKLANVYRMCIEFEILDLRDGSMKDGGTFMQEFEMAPAMYTDGIDSEDKISVRTVLTSGVVKFVRSYRKSTPIGVRQKSRGLVPYLLRIKGVHILQAKANSISGYVSANTMDNYYKSEFSDMIHPDYYNPNPISYRNGQHPAGTFMRQKPPVRHHGVAEYPLYEKFVTIYDSETEGITFDDISFDEDITQITIHVTTTLNNYVNVYDTDTVQALLDANNTSSDDNSLPSGDLEDDKSGLSDYKTDPGDNGVEPPVENTDSTDDNSDDSEKKDDTSSETTDNQGEGTVETTPSTTEGEGISTPKTDESEVKEETDSSQESGQASEDGDE